MPCAFARTVETHFVERLPRAETLADIALGESGLTTVLANVLAVTLVFGGELLFGREGLLRDDKLFDGEIRRGGGGSRGHGSGLRRGHAYCGIRGYGSLR
jgi:hypothetical protein